MKQRVAAIDFGTNTARLLIADRHESGVGFEPVRLERQIVRMGGGFSRESGLSPEAMERGLNCLQRFAEIMGEYRIDAVRAVATSAVRDGKNGPAFQQLVREQTGIVLETIDGIQEGALTLQGVLAGLDTLAERLLIFDVGGGSTEYTVAQSGTATFIRSLPLGVVRLTEGKNSTAAMTTKIDHELAQLQSEMSGASVDWSNATLIGTAGTATTLAAISMGMTDYDYRRVNNSLLTRQEIERIYRMLSPLSTTERLQIAGLEKGREDLIVAGCLLVMATMDAFGCQTLKVSDYGLLEGLVVAGCN